MKHLIIDRFEVSWAVIEYGDDTFHFPKELLPPDAREGDALDFNVLVDRESTRKRRDKIRKLEDELFK